MMNAETRMLRVGVIEGEKVTEYRSGHALLVAKLVPGRTELAKVRAALREKAGTYIDASTGRVFVRIE
jgi:hypothetical protein